MYVDFYIGIGSTCRAIISEVSDDSNQAFGIAVMGAAWGIGYVLGPAVGGTIADPIGQYNLTITSKFLLAHFVMTASFISALRSVPPWLPHQIPLLSTTHRLLSAGYNECRIQHFLLP